MCVHAGAFKQSVFYQKGSWIGNFRQMKEIEIFITSWAEIKPDIKRFSCKQGEIFSPM